MYEAFKKLLLTVCVLLSVSAALADKELERWDKRMAVDAIPADTNGIKWVDGKLLPIEGRAYDDVDCYYDRLPSSVTTNVNGGVRAMKGHSSGLSFRFVTDSKKIIARWKLRNPARPGNNMTGILHSGIDIYVRGRDGKWKYLRTGRPKTNDGEISFSWAPGEECLIYLPLYNGISDFTLGINAGATIKAPARRTLASKPAVFYGTSITHGGCASRPGLGFVNISSRDYDVDIVNLGFSGSGVMEFEMSEHLARIDASCYVLDCLWNMSLEDNGKGRSVKGNYEPFIRNLRAKRPNTPIIMAEQCDVFMGKPGDKDVFIKALYEKLLAEGWTKLYYLPKDTMYTGDREGTVDGCHPNDLGMVTMAKAFGDAVKKAVVGQGRKSSFKFWTWLFDDTSVAR
jgi:hypothetical protein